MRVAPPAGHAYAAVISACAAGGQWQRAVSLFDEMLAWGVRPDVVSCTALITGEPGMSDGKPGGRPFVPLCLRPPPWLTECGFLLRCSWR